MESVYSSQDADEKPDAKNKPAELPASVETIPHDIERDDIIPDTLTSAVDVESMLLREMLDSQKETTTPIDVKPDPLGLEELKEGKPSSLNNHLQQSSEPESWDYIDSSGGNPSTPDGVETDACARGDSGIGITSLNDKSPNLGEKPWIVADDSGKGDSSSELPERLI